MVLIHCSTGRLFIVFFSLNLLECLHFCTSSVFLWMYLLRLLVCRDFQIGRCLIFSYHRRMVGISLWLPIWWWGSHPCCVAPKCMWRGWCSPSSALFQGPLCVLVNGSWMSVQFDQCSDWSLPFSTDGCLVDDCRLEAVM